MHRGREDEYGKTVRVTPLCMYVCMLYIVVVASPPPPFVGKRGQVLLIFV